jgi:hypothetical protein
MLTYFSLKAVTGDADFNNDKQITFQEIYNLVADRGKYRRHGQLFQNRYEQKYDLKARGCDFNRVARRVAEVMEMEIEQVAAFWKSPQTVKARSLLCFWAHRKLGMTTIEIGKRPNISQSAVNRSSMRGQQIERENRFELIDQNA